LGPHRLRTEAAKDTNEKIAILPNATLLLCQELVLEARQTLKKEIDKLDIFSECIKIAQEKWVVICGGKGQQMFLIANTPMQSSTFFLVFLLEDLLVNPQPDQQNVPIDISFQILKRFVEHGHTQSMQFPANVGEIVRKFYNKCVEEFVKIRETPKILNGFNDKAIDYLKKRKIKARLYSNSNAKSSQYGWVLIVYEQKQRRTQTRK